MPHIDLEPTPPWEEQPVTIYLLPSGQTSFMWHPGAVVLERLPRRAAL